MRIFISYRRDDSLAHSLALARGLGDSAIDGQPCELFFDIEAIAPGVNFVQAMTKAVKSSDVALAIIGRHWLVTDGSRRLDAADDPVRLELRTAIETATPLVAVLVDRGTMPKAADLPADIRDVTRSKVVELREKAFDADLARLVSTIGGFPRRSSGPAPATLRLVSDSSGWLTTGDRYDVQVDGKKIGLLHSGPTPMDFVVPAGRHAVRLRRGLRWSDPVTVTVRPGQRTELGYEVGLMKIVLRARS